MKLINLRHHYPHYTADCFVEVSDEVAAAMADFDRAENAHRQRVRRHKAYYSLDRNDGIEQAALRQSPSAADVYQQQADKLALYAAVAKLPPKQAKRLYAHFWMGMSQKEIAGIEQVHPSRIYATLQRGLWCMKKDYKNSCEGSKNNAKMYW